MIQIIPAIDLIDGKCVRLTRGDFDRKTTYSDDPLGVAKEFESVGIRRLHMVDLDGARAGKPQNLHVLKRVAAETNLEIDFGGGVRCESDLKDVFNSGAAMANIGSVAVKDTALFLSWIAAYGGEKFLLGADTRNGVIAVNGWQTQTSVEVVALLEQLVPHGVTNVFVTDIDCDGAFTGPASGLYQEIIETIPDVNLIASGGVHSVSDIAELERIGCHGVIIGKAIYEGRITPKELAKYAG